MLFVLTKMGRNRKRNKKNGTNKQDPRTQQIREPLIVATLKPTTYNGKKAAKATTMSVLLLLLFFLS